jgi:copper(I)-binding protein
MKKCFRLLLMTSIVSLANIAYAEQDLAFEAAWVRALPPGMKMTAGFGLLRNDSAETIELSGFTSPQFGDVSLHRTELVDGVSRMREVPSLNLAPGESLALEPGGYHLMLMMPVAPIALGERVTLDISADDGRLFRFELPVERR